MAIVRQAAKEKFTRQGARDGVLFVQIVNCTGVVV